MTTPPEISHSDLRQAVTASLERPQALAELGSLYTELDAQLLDAVCLGGGACCRFDLAGHRLFVTTLELAMLLQLPPAADSAPLRCPYQIGPKCHSRGYRALGCRTFFCRQGHLQDIYEAYHAKIIELHERFGIPYFYVELTAGIAECVASDE